MNGFLLTPLTRFYAEMQQGMGGTASGVYAGNKADGSFFGTVQEKLSQMDTLRSDFSYYNPWSTFYGGRHTDFANKKKQKSFWEKRAERHKLYMDLAQKAWYKHENEREYQETIDLHRREVSSAKLRQWSLERATGEKVELGVNPDVLSEAATELTQNYVFFKIPSALINPRPKTFK